MKKLIFIVLLIAVALDGARGEPSGRVKIGLVLSGGGAKGFAHVGALKVIEEAVYPSIISPGQVSEVS